MNMVFVWYYSYVICYKIQHGFCYLIFTLFAISVNSNMICYGYDVKHIFNVSIVACGADFADWSDNRFSVVIHA